MKIGSAEIELQSTGVQGPYIIERQQSFLNICSPWPGRRHLKESKFFSKTPPPPTTQPAKHHFPRQACWSTDGGGCFPTLSETELIFFSPSLQKAGKQVFVCNTSFPIQEEVSCGLPTSRRISGWTSKEVPFCILQILVCQMLLQARCTWIADCPCHALRSCQLSCSQHGEAWPGRFLFLALNTTCAMTLWKRRAGEGFAPFCHFSTSQQYWDTFPTPKKGSVCGPHHFIHSTNAAGDHSATVLWAGDNSAEIWAPLTFFCFGNSSLVHSASEQNQPVHTSELLGRYLLSGWITFLRLLSFYLFSIWSKNGTSVTF